MPKWLAQRLKLLRAVYRDPRTPWHARAVLGATLAYAVSPIDLIPDFIPLIGHLDDLVIVPLGLALAYVLVPREVWREHGARLGVGRTDGAHADGQETKRK
ncbi:MAG: hypothetical protein AMK73_07435 [Planctomycetes bacterium SM23_32]|nr:MAG: hypothetical protein AMK73_07435 [Planctomycetes bacterium SM23_32]